MKLLQENSDFSQPAMAKVVGMSFGGVNYCLNEMTEKGLINISIFSQKEEKNQLCLLSHAER